MRTFSRSGDGEKGDWWSGGAGARACRSPLHSTGHYSRLRSCAPQSARQKPRMERFENFSLKRPLPLPEGCAAGRLALRQIIVYRKNIAELWEEYERISKEL